MKKTLVALAAAAAISPAAFAGDISFKGDANVEGFHVDADGIGEAVAGYSSRIRLAGTAKADGNISVNFRLLLNNSTWAGDNHSGGITGAYEHTGSDAVAVDYGYIQMPVAGWTVRVGRQVANWAGCFITCNENRDRLLAMKRFGSTTAIFINDKRIEGDINLLNPYVGPVTDNSASDDDSDMYAAAAIGMHKGWLWGILFSHWAGAENVGINGVTALMPYVKGKISGVDLEASLNYLGGGDALFTDSHWSGFVRAGYDFGTVRLDGLALMTAQGGLIDVGFDTYSMTLNNNPKTNASNTNAFSSAGIAQIVAGPFGRSFGNEDLDEWLISGKLSGKVAEGVTLSGAVGFGTQDVDGGAETDYTFFNVKANYQLAKTTEVYAGIESLNIDVDGLGDSDLVAANVGVTTTF